GGDGPASTLMFAKFSPDGGRVGWVRYGENNLYVEDIASGKMTQLTHDGSRTTINGTFDWVYEEELGLRDGWRWSPDGRSIAYWQLDATGVRDFLLINDTDSLYSFTIPVQYPKAGTTNSAARIGVVSAAGGPTAWMKIPGDPRNNYLARMDWAAGSTQLITPGDYDVMQVAKIDLRGGWLYFEASPERATQSYLWRTRLDGSGRPERLTPASQPGTHDYDVGPNARYAVHRRSAWGTPPTEEIVRLPTHETARTLVTNDRLRERLAPLAKGAVEWFQVPTVDGRTMDGWLMKPANFDSTKKY